MPKKTVDLEQYRPSIFDDYPIEIECPDCEADAEVTIKQLRRKEKVTCESCGYSASVPKKPFTRILRMIEKTTLDPAFNVLPAALEMTEDEELDYFKQLLHDKIMGGPSIVKI